MSWVVLGNTGCSNCLVAVCALEDEEQDFEYLKVASLFGEDKWREVIRSSSLPKQLLPYCFRVEASSSANPGGMCCVDDLEAFISRPDVSFVGGHKELIETLNSLLDIDAEY